MPKVTNKERQRCWRHRMFLGGNKMSEADKLLYEAGYIYKGITQTKSLKYYKNDDEVIYFDEDKTVKKDGEYCESYYGVTMQELKAINMKCRELGWSDE